MSEEQQPQHLVVETEPQKIEIIGEPPLRDNQGRFLVGHRKIEGSGRPRNTLKEFSRALYASWTDEQKLEFLEKIAPIDRWRMAEGNPQTDVTSAGEKIEVIPILGGKSVPKDDSVGENTPAEQAN